MGLYDLFYDEDSTCPKCRAKIKHDWQTKSLQSLMEVWRKGDFLQYTKLEVIPERERKKKYGDSPLAPAFRRTKKYLTDAPLVFNGKIPVHTSCPRCGTWLGAYAKITKGKFQGIVEVERDGAQKQLVTMPEETTATDLRAEFEGKLSHLQESCKHEKSRWTYREPIPLHPSVKVRVCLKCEKILERKEGERIGEQALKRIKAGEKEHAGKRYVVAKGTAEIRKALSSVRDPLPKLIGKKTHTRRIPIDELEEIAETR